MNGAGRKCNDTSGLLISRPHFLAALEHFQKYCSHLEGKKNETVFLGFGFVSARSQGFLNLLLHRSLAKTPKILAPNGYRIFSNALTLNQRRSHETRNALPKPIALSQELQTEPTNTNPPGIEIQPGVPSLPAGPTTKKTMNANSGPVKNGDDHCYDSALNRSASKLDVYRHEQLANTEPPVLNSVSRPISKRMSAVLKAMYHWVLSRS